MQAGQFGTQGLKIGGGIPVFSDSVTGLNLIGGNISPDRLPDVGNRLPSATPLFVDDAARTIDVHYAFEVIEAVAADGVAVKVKKIMGNSIAKVGMALMKAPTAVTGTGAAYAITAIDRTNAEYDVLTLGTTLGALAIGDILMEADGVGAGKKIKVLPNLLSFYDLEKLPYAETIHFNGIYNSPEAMVYENRISPVAKIIKDYMMANGCWFRFTKGKN